VGTYTSNKASNVFIYFDDNLVSSVTGTPLSITAGTTTVTGTDTVRIGGPYSFLGLIADFQILTPGSTGFQTRILNIKVNILKLNIASSICSSWAPQCALIASLTTPALCMGATCDGSCGKCVDTTATGCVSCASGRYMYNQMCVAACPSQYYVNGNFCDRKSSDLLFAK
jgi:hypothetical protein